MEQYHRPMVPTACTEIPPILDPIKRGYCRTQVSWAIITVAGVLAVYTTYLLAAHGTWFIVMLSSLIISSLLFYKLTIEGCDDWLELRLGIGLIRTRIPYNQIESCMVAEAIWYYGLGGDLTPLGWFYNLSGTYAVEIWMVDGRRYLIGCDTPGELQDFVRRHADTCKSARSYQTHLSCEVKDCFLRR